MWNIQRVSHIGKVNDFARVAFSYPFYLTGCHMGHNLKEGDHMEHKDDVRMDGSWASGTKL